MKQAINSNQLLNQSGNHAIIRPSVHSDNQAIDQSKHQPNDQANNQTSNQPITRTIKQSAITQTTKQ